jgi:hypothetical protein
MADAPDGLPVGATGFEPATFRPPVECATRLRHAPRSAQSTAGSVRSDRRAGTRNRTQPTESGRPELNRHRELGRLLCNRYTTPAGSRSIGPPRSCDQGLIERGSQGSNLESPVLETGALPIWPLPPAADRSGASGANILRQRASRSMERSRSGTSRTSSSRPSRARRSGAPTASSAGGGTRTPTGRSPPGPKPGAYSNSATPADRQGTVAQLQRKSYDRLRWP